ncbi:arabinofuranosyltransferase [Actinomycetospora lemnae]|uniref:Galactan 5-O-arabinofuranosyltransferase n=1 Tax=Actinomycetospora lemnae TaxID=3019891 RepID=A0ABT5SWJ4_9PSEU|nr:arabinofuranosyltransferase [Actinomycetospora sp. DW7H6]MDD7966362.1 arabinofuranosyltransferase [Actinomycetospora sp. DW7H6]
MSAVRPASPSAAVDERRHDDPRPGQAPDIPGPSATTTLLRLGGSVVVAVLGAGLTSLVVQLAVGRLTIPRPSFVPTALTAISVLLTAGLLALVHARASPRLVAAAGVVLPAAITTAALSSLLAGTRFYLFGTDGDQAFRMQYLGRFAASAALADGNYADLPSFYPPAWFWLGGRLADLTGLPAWVVYKPYSIATMAVAASLAVVLWRRVVDGRTALVLGTTTAVVGLLVGAYEPYGWIVAACIPPLVVLGWRLFTEHGAPRPERVAAVVLLGVVGGVAAITYTLFAGFFFLALGLAAVAAAAVGGGGWRAARVVGGRLVLVVALTVVLALPVWAPFLVAALGDGTAGNGSALYLPEVGAIVGTPMFEASVVGVLCLVGAVWIAVRARHRAEAAGLAMVAVAAYVYAALSLLALAVGTTLLSFKLEFVLTLALACAGVLALGEAVGVAGRRLGARGGRDLRRGVAVLAVLACVHLVQTPSEDVAPLLEGAFTARDDQGVSAVDPAPRPDDPGSLHPKLAAAIGALTGRPPQDLVVLTDHWPIMVFAPYRGYQTVKQEYANPLAHYPQRDAEITRWAGAPDAGALRRMLDEGPFRAPDVLVLRREDRGLVVTLAENVFPLSAGSRYRDVVFAPRLFDAPGFRRADVGPFTVIARVSP